RWMLGQTKAAGQDSTDLPRPDLVRKFFDYLEANAEEYWHVPRLEAGAIDAPDEKEDDLFGAAYEGVTYRDTADDDQEGAVVGDDSPRDEFDLETQGELLGRRLRFLSTLARLWQVASRREPADAEAVAGWLATARLNQRKLLSLLESLHGHLIPEASGSHESLVEDDRRPVLKEQLIYAVIGTSLDNYLAIGSLRGVSEATAVEQSEDDRPAWEPLVIRIERAFFKGDIEATRSALPSFLEQFAEEPMLAPA